MHDQQRSRRKPLALLPLALLAAPAAAQDFNVDCSQNGLAVPADTYGAAANVPGFWNLLQDSGQLRDLNGNLAPVFVAVPSGGTFTGADPCAMGDDAALFNDFKDPGNNFFRFSGLQPGDYVVYTYAMATDDPTFRTDVSVQGSVDPLTTVGGDFCGGFVQGVTHAVHTVTTTNGIIFVDLAVNNGFATVNGFQIDCVNCVDTTGTPVCFGDGSGTPCPCGNTGGSGEGCANSTGSGASLDGSGTASVSNDTVTLLAGNAIPNQPGLFFQGNNTIGGGAGSIFGDGLRCCGGSVIRLEVVVPNGAGDAQTSVPIAADGGVMPGDTRCYQYWYRNPGGGSPCGAGFNLTNGYEITWS
jgi:hypothetical protein